MNYTYRLPIFEAPGDAFAKMSDDQFNDYKQKNPGGADKADRVRKQAQARANKSNNTSTQKGGPLAKRGGNSQGSQSNKVGGSSDSKRVSSAGGKAVDMGVKKVKVRDVTPEKKISGSGDKKDSGSSSGSSSGGIGGPGGQRRPPSGAGGKEMTREKGGALAKTAGKKPGTPKPKGKGGMKLRSKGHLAAKAIGWAAGVAKDTIGGATAAFGKSSWKEGITFQQYVDTVVPILESAAWQRKEGKNKKGGLNEKGRKSYERENPGSDLKAPQPEGGPRKRSFCARMGGVKGPMKKPNGEPTRKALALRKWKC